MKRFNLRKERRARNWSGEYVATKIGMTRAGYFGIENGHKTPSYKSVCALEDVFGLGHRYLLEIKNVPAESL